MKRYIRATDDEDRELSIDELEGAGLEAAFTFNVKTRQNLAIATDSPEVLEVLALDSDQLVRKLVAKNPHTPLEVLADFIGGRYDDQRAAEAALAERLEMGGPFPGLTPEDLYNIPEEARNKIGHSAGAPILLDILSQDPSQEVRSHVAGNFRIAREIFDRLVSDPDRFVRSSLADNIDAPEDILRVLSEDPAWIVRYSVAFNRRTPRDILERWANRSGDNLADSDISEKARDTLSRIAEQENNQEDEL